MHNPNPFDFVPFPEHPILKTPEEFAALGELWSGYLEVRLTALTPVHVVGSQEHRDQKRFSRHYRQGGRPCLPAASLRGCLRAFIEALTAGWVSQATPEYEKKYKERHVGFAAFKQYVNRSQRTQRITRMGPAINPEFMPCHRPDGALDIASYLFGHVFEKEPGVEIPHAALARKSRVWVEDAFLSPGDLDRDHYWAPDLYGEAFMGGAKPSASNWWYMQPKEIRQRNVDVNGQMIPMAEFIGEKFWGRKFYYHQNPECCVQYYHPRSGNWNYRQENPFSRVGLECLRPGAVSEPFRIYLQRVPRALLILLALCLQPGRNIRHKLGYGKAYGYGSCQFEMVGAYFRVETKTGPGVPDELEDRLAEVQGWAGLAWERENLAAAGLSTDLIDWTALNHLARILGWENADRLLFTYPPFKPAPFKPGYFARGISTGEFNQRVGSNLPVKGGIVTTERQALQLAEKLFTTKSPIHFRLYQQKAQGWDLIQRRRP